MNSKTHARAVLVPDIHQDVDFLQGILAHEDDGECSFILLGDYFDPRGSDYASVSATCQALTEARARLGERLVMLCGNHDTQYLEVLPRARSHQGLDALRIHHATGNFTASKAKSIAQQWDESFVAQIEPLALAHGWLLSHAGIHADFWPRAERPEQALDALYQRLRRALSELTRPDPALGGVGQARGGFEAHGGVTWQDWDHEFEDSLPYPQIVGHTREPEPRSRGRSHCIDCCQQRYAVIAPTRPDEAYGAFELRERR